MFRRAVELGQERSTTLAQLLDQMSFLFVAESEFTIEPASWEKLASVERVAEVLDATIAHVEACEWSVHGIDPRPVIEGLGLKARKVMPALYAAVEGRAEGLPLFDAVYLLGRERTLARLRGGSLSGSAEPWRAGSARASPAEAPGAVKYHERSPFRAIPIRGWCNRQHNWFWSSYWGFESSPRARD